jgi:hypothetical protein
MKRFVVLGMTLALAAAAGPANAANTGTDGGGPPFISGKEGGTIVVHCKSDANPNLKGTVVFQQKKDPPVVIGGCTPTD